MSETSQMSCKVSSLLLVARIWSAWTVHIYIFWLKQVAQAWMGYE